MGRLLAIAKHHTTRGPITTMESATISIESGVDDDCNGAPGPRQVTVVSSEAWSDACGDLDAEVAWTARRANLLVEGVALEETTGSRLRVGGAVLEITGETKPCGLMDQQHHGLKAALQPSWRGGVTCRVVEGATVAVGDPVSLEPGS